MCCKCTFRYISRVTRKGIQSLNELSETAKQYIAVLPIDTLTGKYYENFSELLGFHGDTGDMKMYQSQNVWDATMAWNIAKRYKNNVDGQILHINGKFHSDQKLGTCAHLQRYAPHINIMNISCNIDEDFDAPDWVDKADLGDFIILTNPNVQRTY